MKEYSFYNYYEDEDKINIYSDDVYDYFNLNYNIIIGSIDFDQNQNVILYIENNIGELINPELEKKLLDEIKHLNDVEIKKTKIVLSFDVNKIEIF